MKTKIFAHRGASFYAPENTLEAFELAIKQKANGVELDVQLTKDNKLVVIHDETINRTSNGKGFVKDFTLEELKKFNFNNSKADFSNVKIPTLEEVYDLLKYTDLIINVEIKNSIVPYKGIEKILTDLDKKMNMNEQIIYSSFNHYALLKMKEISKKYKTGLLFSDLIVNVVSYSKNLGVDYLHPPGYALLNNPSIITEANENNLPINTWTIDLEEDLKIAFNLNLNSIISNKPDFALKILNDNFK